MISDREFWTPILQDADVSRFCLRNMATVDDFLEWITLDNVHPLRKTNGGFVFVDIAPNAQEVHVSFLPEERGKPIAAAFRETFLQKMQEKELIVAHEWEDNWRSKPPRSYGFVPDGVFNKSIVGVRCKRWVLTRDAWERSPVFRKLKCHS